ncbi:MAG: hypothetical protein J6Y82_09945 [Bacteroidales bacterium]|nr:hypothetical protein [Bacteroidales bacterium]
MASIKDLKKQLSNITNELVAVLCIKNTDKGVSDEKVSELIVKSIKLKKDFIDRINAQGENGKRDKAFFKAIKDDYNKQIDELVKEINAL